jgi:hypothetical protein
MTRSTNLPAKIIGIGATAVLIVKASATCTLLQPRASAKEPENTLKA